MPQLLPVVGSAASPSAAHTDPYHLFIALATSSCHSKAPSHLETKKKEEEEMAGVMEMMEKPETKKRWITPQWPVLLIEAAVLLPRRAGWCAGLVSISVTGKQKRRKRRQRSADERYERPRRQSPREPASSRSRRWAEDRAVSTAREKRSRWNNVLSEGLFIRLYIDVRWHWSAYNQSRASALAVHRIRFHFTVPELATHSAGWEESSRQHWMCVL